MIEIIFFPNSRHLQSLQATTLHSNHALTKPKLSNRAYLYSVPDRPCNINNGIQYPHTPSWRPRQCGCSKNSPHTRIQCPGCVNRPNICWPPPPGFKNPYPGGVNLPASAPPFPPNAPAFHGPNSTFSPSTFLGHSYPPKPVISANHPKHGLGAKPYYWVDTFARGAVPTTALHAGHDIDGTQTFVGRAFHEGDWIPAKVIPEKNVAYVAYGGAEHPKDRYQVLCEQRFDWEPTSGGQVPPGAVEGGRTSDGETLYIGRVHHDGALTVGKVHFEKMQNRIFLSKKPCF
uniref:Uncharacterized protein n=1 Tax=Dendroctonus ponderosae TaxID=77166 RepID=A0AAR5P7J1_DENPD